MLLLLSGLAKICEKIEEGLVYNFHYSIKGNQGLSSKERDPSLFDTSVGQGKLKRHPLRKHRGLGPRCSLLVNDFQTHLRESGRQAFRRVCNTGVAKITQNCLRFLV